MCVCVFVVCVCVCVCVCVSVCILIVVLFSYVCDTSVCALCKQSVICTPLMNCLQIALVMCFNNVFITLYVVLDTHVVR